MRRGRGLSGDCMRRKGEALLAVLDLARMERGEAPPPWPSGTDSRRPWFPGLDRTGNKALRSNVGVGALPCRPSPTGEYVDATSPGSWMAMGRSVFRIRSGKIPANPPMQCKLTSERFKSAWRRRSPAGSSFPSVRLPQGFDVPLETLQIPHAPRMVVVRFGGRRRPVSQHMPDRPGNIVLLPSERGRETVAEQIWIDLLSRMPRPCASASCCRTRSG